MLWRRLASTFLFLPVFLTALLLGTAGDLMLAFMGAFCGIWGLAEFFELGSIRGARPPRRWLYGMTAAAAFLIYARHLLSQDLPWLIGALLGLCAVALVGTLACLIGRGRTEKAWETFLVSFAGPVYVVCPILLIQVFHQLPGGVWMIAFAFLTTWLSDTGAYFGGRKLGRHKLAPAISPGKTVEGSLCGAVLSLAGILALGFIQGTFQDGELYWTEGSGADWLRLSLLAVGLVCTGTLGDLAESMLKRDLGVKDSGSALTGHGGFLDIMDSLLVNLPLLFVWVLLFEGSGFE